MTARRSPFLAGLSTLGLGAHDIGDSGIRALVRRPTSLADRLAFAQDAKASADQPLGQGRAEQPDPNQADAVPGHGAASAETDRSRIAM